MVGAALAAMLALPAAASTLITGAVVYRWLRRRRKARLGAHRG